MNYMISIIYKNLLYYRNALMDGVNYEVKEGRGRLYQFLAEG